jgi:hypothetical protein
MNWINQCEELWGEKWKSTLALTANVPKRTVFRWYSGEFGIPQGVVEGIEQTWEIWRA